MNQPPRRDREHRRRWSSGRSRADARQYRQAPDEVVDLLRPSLLFLSAHLTYRYRGHLSWTPVTERRGDACEAAWTLNSMRSSTGASAPQWSRYAVGVTTVEGGTSRVYPYVAADAGGLADDTQRGSSRWRRSRRRRRWSGGSSGRLAWRLLTRAAPSVTPWYKPERARPTQRSHQSRCRCRGRSQTTLRSAPRGGCRYPSHGERPQRAAARTTQHGREAHGRSW